MNNGMQYPIERMRQQAQAVQNETANLTDETHARIQAMQQQHASMPTSMQSTFGDFITLMQQHFSNGLILRAHIGKSLTEAANVVQDADTTISQEFK